MKVRGEWFVYVDPEGDPHIVIRKAGGGDERIPTREECEYAVKILNEDGSTAIRLQCRTKGCKDEGGWIERSRKDAEKNIYHCQVCGRPMER